MAPTHTYTPTKWRNIRGVIIDQDIQKYFIKLWKRYGAVDAICYESRLCVEILNSHSQSWRFCWLIVPTMCALTKVNDENVSFVYVFARMTWGHEMVAKQTEIHAKNPEPWWLMTRSNNSKKYVYFSLPLSFILRNHSTSMENERIVQRLLSYLLRRMYSISVFSGVW